jgi:hypothetical protein
MKEQEYEEMMLQARVEETVGTMLLKAMVQEFTLLPKPWEKLPKKQQDEVIDRLRGAVEEAVTGAVMQLAAKERPTLAVVIEKVEFKDGGKAIVKFERRDPARMDLTDAVGDVALLVVAAPKAETEGMDRVEGEEDQRAMALGHEYDDER